MFSALRLSVFAVTEPLQLGERYCGNSSGGQILVIVPQSNEEYVVVYLIGKKTIQKKKFQHQITDFQVTSCYVRYRQPQIGIYLISQSRGLSFILSLKINQESEGSTLQTKTLREAVYMKGSCFDEENDEVYLLFNSHIQSLSGSLEIAHQEIFFQYGQNTPFFNNWRLNEKNFIFFNEEYPKLEVIKIDLNGKVERKLVHNFDMSSKLTYFPTFNHHDGLIHVSISGDSNISVFIDSYLNVFVQSSLIEDQEYKFFKFGEKENHMFVYKRTCLDCSYSVCYCKYLIQQTGVKIEEVVGCYSKGINSLNWIKELEIPDGQQYFLFGDAFVNERRKDSNSEDDQNLYFPNKLYSSIYQQFGVNNSFVSSHSGQIVEFVQFPNEDGPLGKQNYGTKIVVEGPQVVIHPGILAGVVFGGFLVLILFGTFIFFCYRCCKNCCQKYANRRSQSGNNENHPQEYYFPNQNNPDNQNNDSSKDMMNKLELALDRQQRMAKRMGNEEKCCICLEMGCTAYLKCVHFFHQDCIVEWLNRNSKCPLCQKSANKKEIVKFK